MKPSLLIRFLALGLAGAVTLPAKLPFEAVATTALPANNIHVSASGSSFEDFISSLITASGQFSLLRNQPFDARATFLGVPDAMSFSTNASGTRVAMALNPIAFSRVFTGPTSDDVDRQIREFFQKHGLEIVSDFLAAIAKQSALAVTDGNPNSATAVAANSTFLAQGFTPIDEIVGGLGSESSSNEGSARPRFGGLGIGFNAGRFEAAGFEGETLDLSLTALSIRLGERVRLIAPMHFNYLKIEGAQVAGLGSTIALPIRYKLMSKENPWNWRLTPMAGVSARASVDLAGGALLWQAGLLNSVDYRVSPKLVVCFVNQFTTHKSIKLEYGDYSFDPQIDQQILKNGIRLVAPLRRRVVADLFAVDTRFLKDAAIEQFWTFGGSIGFRMSPRFNLTLGANYDTGDEFKSYAAGLTSAWKW